MRDAPEYRADAVVLLADDAPVFGIIVEAQLAPDPVKRFAWPMYAVSARARHRCPFVVLVVTPDPATARWASEPIDLGGGSWRSLVIGPEGIPIVADADRAARDPHLAVLSVMAHGRDDDVATAVAIALAAASAAAGLPEPLRTLCYALIESSLGGAARKTFEMLPQGQKFFSEAQRRWFAEGEATGAARGQAIGEARGEARAILRILERRGLTVSTDQRERILACTETAALEGWLDRALVAESTEELFVGGGP